jgi:hypothetical protein
LYGGIREENNPALNTSLFELPQTELGQPSTFFLERVPYVEGSVGIANIFKLFRVDLVKRFTYLNNPGVAEWGIRARFKLEF